MSFDYDSITDCPRFVKPFFEFFYFFAKKVCYKGHSVQDRGYFFKNVDKSEKIPYNKRKKKEKRRDSEDADRSERPPRAA